MVRGKFKNTVVILHMYSRQTSLVLLLMELLVPGEKKSEIPVQLKTTVDQ